jgi:RNA polymerase sigma factor (sigma-70 family)
LSSAPFGNSPFDRDLFSRLYEEAMPAVFRYLNYRVGNTAVAEDLTSAVFEKALVAFKTFNPEKSPAEAWLISIARNALIDYFRKNGKKRFVPLDNAALIAASDPLPGEELEQREQTGRLKFCLSKLSHYEQEMLSLKFGAEITNRRIAGMLGLSESNVGTSLFRAIGKLRDCFQEWLNGRGK